MATKDSEEALAQLARQATAGDGEAFKRFVASCTPLVYRIALRLMADRDDAEDVAQEVFIKVHGALTKGMFNSNCFPSAWVRQIATRTALDALRSTQRRRQREECSETAVRIASTPLPETRVRLEEALSVLRELPDMQRVVLVLKEFENFTTKEIASSLKCSEGAVEQRLVRARASLRRRCSSE